MIVGAAVCEAAIALIDIAVLAGHAIYLVSNEFDITNKLPARSASSGAAPLERLKRLPANVHVIMITAIKSARNCLWDVVKKTIPLTIFVNAVSIAIAYAFYQIAFRVSLMPFWLAAGMSILAVVGPGIIVLMDRGKSRLVALGFSNLFMAAAFYFFCGVVPFFFYFLFAPMPTYMHVGGLALGLAMTGYWMAITARDVNRALATSRFVEDAFEDTGSVLQYRLQNMAKLEAVLSSRSPFSKGYMYMVLLIGPLSLVSGRLLTPVFGPHGPILLGALILFPVSQWIAGIATRQYIAMVRLPRMLERTRGKPVIAVSDEGR